MRILICGVILLFSIVVAIFAQDYNENDYPEDYPENGNRAVNSDWFWMGSNLVSLGRPEFKITEHSDGYSVKLACDEYNMEVRYTETDNSLNFTIMDYKGSVKYRFGEFSPDGFEANAELVGGVAEWGISSSSPLTEMPTNVKLKIKSGKQHGEEHEGGHGLDPYVIEVRLTNKMLLPPVYQLVKEMFKIKAPKEVDAVLVISLNPKNWAESTVRLVLNINGNHYHYSGGDSNDPNNWFPANHTMSASLMLISVVEPNQSEKKAKLKAVVDLEEDLSVDEKGSNITNHPRNHDLFKKSIVLEGLINFTGEEDRLAVVKATDAETSKTLGRIQVVRPDEENLRLEVFVDGSEAIALNIYDNSAGITNVTVRASGTDDYRVFESVEGGGRHESRVYKDVFYIGASERVRQREIGGDNGLWLEEKMFAHEEQNMKTYEESLMVNRGPSHIYTMYSKLNNTGQDTNIKLGAMRQRSKNEVDIEIKPVPNEEDEFNLKISYKNKRIFDGYYFQTGELRKYARRELPEMFKQQFKYAKAYTKGDTIMSNEIMTF